MAELRIPIIGEFKGKKAFDQAGKSTSSLEKGVKKLGIALAATFGAQQLLKFGKNAAKAFIEDEKAATRLAQSVKNLGLAFEVPRIEKFISELSRASGVTDDQLRPAMQRLLQTTGSVAKSQELLTQALDVSAGSGVDYETVVNDLSMAYVGQTRGLRKYSLGLSQAELKTMSFADVQEKLSKQFSGSNAAYLETYAGQMSILSNVAGEASETIGKGLVDSLMILSGDTSVEDLAITMETLAGNTANAITEIAKLGKSVANFFSETYGKTDSLADKITDFLDRLTGNSQRITRRNVGRAGRSFGGGSGGAGGNIETPEEKAQRLKREAVEAAALKRQKELAALQKKTLDAQKQQNALTKASKTLEIERIGLTAALRNQVSETDRLSLNLQLALLDKNEAAASKLSGQLDAAVKRQNDLAALLLATPEAANPYRNWMIPADVQAWTAASLGVSVSSLGTTPVPISSAYSDAQMELAMAVNAGQVAEAKLIAVEVYLDGDLVGNAIRDSSINQSLSGSFNSVNRAGRFDQLAE
jgi:hypothetical protein